VVENVERGPNSERKRARVLLIENVAFSSLVVVWVDANFPLDYSISCAVDVLPLEFPRFWGSSALLVLSNKEKSVRTGLGRLLNI
jgi:hypothetical protein